jgi:hypothetical protein
MEENNNPYRKFYSVAGYLALGLVAIILIQFFVFIAWQPPVNGSTADWFKLFQSNKWVGLLSFEFLLIIYNLLSIPLYISFYLLLRRFNRPLMLLFISTSFLSIICFISARPAFEMLYLSDKYALASTGSIQNMLLAAGEILLAQFHGTAFQVSYVLGSLSGIIVSIVMLKTNLFSKTTAYVRIASSILDFGLFIPVIGIYISLFSVLFLMVWNILIARRLFQLSRQHS